jgi:hypothetical protein
MRWLTKRFSIAEIVIVRAITKLAAGGDDFDMQGSAPSGDLKKAVDIGMCALPVARIGCVLGEHDQAVFGRFHVQGIKDLL